MKMKKVTKFMTTVYTNNKYSDYFYLLRTILFVAALFILIYGIAVERGGNYSYYSSTAFLLLIAHFSIGGTITTKLTIDEEKLKVFDRDSKSRPLDIDNLKSIVYKYSKKGRFRKRIIIVEDGAHEIAVDISKSKADEITAHLKRLNPAIEVEKSTKLFD